MSAQLIAQTILLISPGKQFDKRFRLGRNEQMVQSGDTTYGRTFFRSWSHVSSLWHLAWGRAKPDIWLGNLYIECRNTVDNRIFTASNRIAQAGEWPDGEQS